MMSRKLKGDYRCTTAKKENPMVMMMMMMMMLMRMRMRMMMMMMMTMELCLLNLHMYNAYVNDAGVAVAPPKWKCDFGPPQIKNNSPQIKCYSFKVPIKFDHFPK